MKSNLHVLFLTALLAPQLSLFAAETPGTPPTPSDASPSAESVATTKLGKGAPAVGAAHVYKKVDDRELKLYVVKPEDWKATDKRPAVVFFHGGGWVGGGPSQFNDQSTYLATRGVVCVQVDYRLLGKAVAGMPSPPIVCVQDAKSAMRWVRSHAGELGIDPQRIGAGGGSAGGHLAAFVGMVEGQDDPADDKSVSPKANAMLLFNPVFDNGPDGGWGYERVGDRYAEFSPAHNIRSDAPPAIVFLGTSDKLIPVRVVERFQAGMKAAGVRCDTSFFPDQPHGFFGKDPWKSETLFEADKFLASIGWIQGPPTLKQPDMTNLPTPPDRKAGKKAAPDATPATQNP